MTRDAPSTPPSPGDLYVLPASAEHGVEWLVVEAVGPVAADGTTARWLLVPADTRPEAGSGDIELFAGEPAGPLVLRAAHAVTARAALLEPRLRTRRVAAEVVERVREQRRRAEAGEPEEDWLAEETDASPSYRAWIEEVVRPAVDAVRSAAEPETGPPGPGTPPGVPARTPAAAAVPDDDTTGSTAVRPFPNRRRDSAPASWVHALAAVLALAVIGLSFHTLQLRQELRRPVWIEGQQEVPVTLFAERSGDETVQVRPDALLWLILPQEVKDRRVRFRVVDPEGREWTSKVVDNPSRDAGGLDLAPIGLPDTGDAVLILEVDDPVDGWREVARVTLRLVPPPSPDSAR